MDTQNIYSPKQLKITKENTYEIAGRVGYFAIGFLVAMHIVVYFQLM